MSPIVNIQTPILAWSGWIEVICGSMFSGKTEELIRRLKRAQIAKQRVQIFKPRIDNRYSEEEVMSHSALKIQAQNIEAPEQILDLLADNTQVVGIDEAQFLNKSVISISQRLANRGLRVVIAGLDLDSQGQPFGPMPELMAIAEYVSKMNAICTACGGIASRTQRKQTVKDHSSQILVGADDHYEARCRRCFDLH